MFQGFTDETVQFFLDLKFHNNTGYFHAHHDRYVDVVQQPFYSMIDALAPSMLIIDPSFETRPYKCLSRIHRDTRFSRDKSPYRDHHWFLFRKAAEPREGSLFYYFEFGPDRLSWGMGVWGENRELFDQFRKRILANPNGIDALIRDLDLPARHLSVGGRIYKKTEIPSSVPPLLRTWYPVRDLYVGRDAPEYQWAFSDKIVSIVQKDFKALAPLYKLLRGCAEELPQV